MDSPRIYMYMYKDPWHLVDMLLLYAAAHAVTPPVSIVYHGQVENTRFVFGGGWMVVKQDIIIICNVYTFILNVMMSTEPSLHHSAAAVHPMCESEVR